MGKYDPTTGRRQRCNPNEVGAAPTWDGEVRLSSTENGAGSETRRAIRLLKGELVVVVAEFERKNRVAIR
jgi:hypothetical protein